MSLDFPSSPVNGQTYNNYVWDSSVGAWLAQGSTNNVGDQIAGLQAKFPVSVANGGTGVTTVAGAQENLGVALTVIKPTSVQPIGSGSSAVLNDRSVTFSNCSAIELFGIFSSQYRNYKIIIDGLQAGNTGTLDWSYAALGNSGGFGGSYGGGFNGVEAGYTSITNNTYPTVALLTYMKNNQFFANDVTVFSPNRAVTTHLMADSIGYAPGNSIYRSQAGVIETSTTQWTNLKFIIQNGTMSGQIQVFGYND